MATQTEQPTTAHEGLWAKLGITDWELGWLGLGITWLFSPVWVKIALPCLVIALIAWLAMKHDGEQSIFTAAKAFATGKPKRFVGQCFMGLTGFLLVIGYALFAAIASDSNKQHLTLSEAFTREYQRRRYYYYD